MMLNRKSVWQNVDPEMFSLLLQIFDCSCEGVLSSMEPTTSKCGWKFSSSLGSYAIASLLLVFLTGESAGK